MNYLFCCRSGRRVAVDVSPGTDEVGTFLPSPISSYFPVVSLSCLLSYLLVELAAPVSQGPVQLLCGCRINSKIAFKCFQVLFFFFSLLTSLVAELWLTNLIAEHAGSGPVLRTAARRQGGTASPGYAYYHKLESQLGVISTLLGEVTCF